MRPRFVTNALAALVAAPLVSAPAAALPEDQAFFTDFEDVFPNTSPGEIIVVGVSPETAELGGNAFGGRIGVVALYHSGVRSWIVQANGTGVINFETDAATVEFFARVLASATGDTVITAFDASDVIVDGPATISPGTGWQLVSLTGSIARIDVENLDGAQLNGIDDFGYTPVPEPSAALMLLSGGGTAHPSLPRANRPVVTLPAARDPFDWRWLDRRCRGTSALRW